MAPTVQSDTTASAVTSLSQTLQQDPTAENILTRPETDVAFINSRVSDVDLLFNQLSKYRAALQHGLNSRVPRICTIPPETLGEIFKYVCDPSSAEPMTPMGIGAICRHWRQVAWSVPQLWTELSVGRGFWKSTDRLELLFLFFKNVGVLRFNITFRSLPEKGGEGPQSIPQEIIFDLLFVEYAHKLRALTFYNTPDTWLLHINNVTRSGQGLPNLESFVVLNEGHDNDIYDLEDSPLALYNVPQLRKLGLDRTTQALIFPWTQLTELSLLDINSVNMLNIILQCENLVALKLRCEFEVNDTPIALPREPVVFRHLQSFEYDGRLAPHWEKALAQCISFPSLERLTWLTRDGKKGLRKKFLLRLPASLSQLEIGCCGDTDNVQNLKIIFARLTSLRSIVFYLNDPLGVEVVRLLMAADRRHFLPSLRSVLFAMVGSKYNAQQLSEVNDIVRSRWVMQGEKDLFEGPKFTFPIVEEESEYDGITSEDD